MVAVTGVQVRAIAESICVAAKFAGVTGRSYGVIAAVETGDESPVEFLATNE